MLSYKDLEKIENLYFLKIENLLRENIDLIMTGLDSKNAIWDTWKKEFEITHRENYKSSILNKGAERIFCDVFPVSKSWKPNSSPIGADLMYETEDAFLHII